MNVALIQFNAGPNKEDNVQRAAAMAQEALAGGAKFVLLPEVFVFRGDMRDTAALQGAAETVPGPAVRTFAALARAHKAHILLGSILETPKSHGKVGNVSVLIKPDGSVGAKYRKIHLFEARLGDKILRESDCFTPGRGGRMARCGDFKVGLSICYDVRFPAMYRRYGQQGAQALTVPSCFTQKTGQAHWEVLLRARAVENLCYVLAPNQVGKDHRGIAAYGNSMIVSPWGEVLARGSDDKEEIVYGEIHVEDVKTARRILPGVI